MWLCRAQDMRFSLFQRISMTGREQHSDRARLCLQKFSFRTCNIQANQTSMGATCSNNAQTLTHPGTNVFEFKLGTAKAHTNGKSARATLADETTELFFTEIEGVMHMILNRSNKRQLRYAMVKEGKGWRYNAPLPHKAKGTVSPHPEGLQVSYENEYDNTYGSVVLVPKDGSQTSS